MKKIRLLIPSVIIALAFLLLHAQPNKQPTPYDELFKNAEALFNGDADEQTDSLALSYFNLIIKQATLSPATARLLYNCFERTGILKQGLGINSPEILKQFHTSLQIHRNYHLPDSLLFRLLLSIGNQHYADGLFDSSVFYFSWAEKIISSYPKSGHSEDLYNSLGALYSESGDYKQSGDYFSKALEIIRKTRPDLTEAIFAMSMNVASSLRLSGKLDSAIFLYKKLIQPGIQSVPLINNLSRIYLAKKMPDSALAQLKKVNDVPIANTVTYYNLLALAYMQKNDTGNASKYLNNASLVSQKNNQKEKSNTYGSTCKYFGDLRFMEDKPVDALYYYQQAIIQFSFKFNNENIFENPTSFIGDFASFDLFEALLAKANCFAELYKTEHKIEIFNTAKNTYKTAFVLADYIKKSIDNDASRLFIADKVFEGYRKGVDFIMNEQAQTQSQQLNMMALEWISKSRATSLAISLKESYIKKYAGIPDSLLQKEKNTKLSLSRLKLQLLQAKDSASKQLVLSLVNTAELQLHDILSGYKKSPVYYRQKFEEDSIDIAGIQQNLLNNNTGIICYFKGEKSMYIFLLKKSTIIFKNLNEDSLLDHHLEKFTENLHQNEPGKDGSSSVSSKYLYNALMAPLVNYLDNINSLIIIPDQDLINLPFETLQKEDGTYFVEKYCVTYQYALPFLRLNTTVFNKDNALAIAPFANGDHNPNPAFSTLSSSLEEINTFEVKQQLLNENATRDNFLTAAPFASVIHLATHSIVNYENPSDSYIAFYPAIKEDSIYKLYAHELYNFSLPNTRLVFLSACETGTGKISKSEGALSISRAFAFAGCTNIVTSLWKADDKSTAYISRKFYYYLDKNYTYSRALQQAKKDLIADPSMSQYHSPQYWGHLIFIGDVQQSSSFNRTGIVISIVLAVAVLLYYLFRRKISKSTPR